MVARRGFSEPSPCEGAALLLRQQAIAIESKWLPALVTLQASVGQSHLCSFNTCWQHEMVEHLGAAPSVSWSQARRIAVFLMPE